MNEKPEPQRILRLRKSALDTTARCLLMGILNITPDSFSDGGAYHSTGEAVERAVAMVADGADIIDIGGESTRPGAAPVAASEELRRILPVIEGLRARSDVPISIDTRRAAVAAAAIDAGADIINDVSALRHDMEMAGVAARTGAPVVLMHMQGTPQTMQREPSYRNVVEEVKLFFTERVAFCRGAGIDQIILDPGIGFGKTVAHNLALLRGLPAFLPLGFPLLVGTSRKAFIGAVTGAAVAERLPGTIASSVLACANGACILRVHDVREMRAAIEITEAIIHGEASPHAV